MYNLHYGGVWVTKVDWFPNMANIYYEEYIGNIELSIYHTIDIPTGNVWEQWAGLCIDGELIPFTLSEPIVPGNL